MKKWLTLLIVAIFAVVLVACSDDNDMDDNEDMGNETKQGSSNDGTTNNNSDDTNMNDDHSDMIKQMDELDYTDFELGVSYGEDREYEAEIEQKSGRVQADLEDEINGVDVNGKKAFDELYPKVKKLEVNRDTKKEEVIKQVLETFELENDYQEFEAEFTFKDGTKLGFKDMK